MWVLIIALQNKGNYDNTLGKPAGECLYEQQSVFSKLPKKEDPNAIYMPRWRKLKAKGLCDVLSIEDVKVGLIIIFIPKIHLI